jgi:hypothetical protein
MALKGHACHDTHENTTRCLATRFLDKDLSKWQRIHYLPGGSVAASDAT